MQSAVRIEAREEDEPRVQLHVPRDDGRTVQARIMPNITPPWNRQPKRCARCECCRLPGVPFRCSDILCGYTLTGYAAPPLRQIEFQPALRLCKRNRRPIRGLQRSNGARKRRRRHHWRRTRCVTGGANR